MTKTLSKLQRLAALLGEAFPCTDRNLTSPQRGFSLMHNLPDVEMWKVRRIPATHIKKHCKAARGGAGENSFTRVAMTLEVLRTRDPEDFYAARELEGLEATYLPRFKCSPPKLKINRKDSPSGRNNGDL